MKHHFFKSYVEVGSGWMKSAGSACFFFNFKDDIIYRTYKLWLCGSLCRLRKSEFVIL